MKSDGGPAFPYPMNFHTAIYGMSLRDWFAGQALVGLLTNPQNNPASFWAPEHAYIYADAMLKERKKE